MKIFLNRFANVFEYLMVFALISSSVYLLAESASLEKVRAAGDRIAYSSEWTATKMIGAIFPQKSSGATGAGPQKIAIGPSQWTVKGTYGTTAFKEIWNTPGDGNLGVTIGKMGVDQCRYDYREGGKQVCGSDYLGVIATNGNFNASDWLFSYAGGNNESITYFTNGDPSTFGETDSWPKWTYGNGAMKCTVSNGGDHNCTYASGMYGVTQAESMSNARGSSQVSRAGTFMPLKWSVSGTICSDKTDSACQ